MAKRFICLLIAASAVPVVLFAQGGATAAGGTLTLDKKTYTLKQALAYETTIDDEDAVAVVLSGQAISSEQFDEARKAEKEGGDPDFKRPFLRLVFKKTGEIKYWSAAAGGTSIGRRSGTAAGELKVQEGRVNGKATVSADAQGMSIALPRDRLTQGRRFAAGVDRQEGRTSRQRPAVCHW
jgi:hypothetical protein